MVFASSNTMQTTGDLQTMRSSNTAVNKNKQLPTAASMPTSRMALQRGHQGHHRGSKNHVIACQGKVAQCCALIFMAICGQNGCAHPQHCTSAAGWKVTIGTIFWHQRGIQNER
eukprot:CCRYP_003844-RA/>CCRYP_003844-RA protein AED:0.52 eAED:0.33 QI:0/-1/0/1/-1/0/1/0/113